MARLIFQFLFAVILLWGFVSGFYASALNSYPVAFLAHDLLGWVVLPTCCLILGRHADGLTAPQVGLGPIGDFAKLRLIFQIAAVVSIYLSFSIVQALLFDLLPPTSSSFSYQKLHLPVSSVTLAIYWSLTGAVVEEIFYKGLLFRAIFRATRPISSAATFVVLSATLFAINHWSQGAYKILSTAFIGFTSAWLYLKWPNLWLFIVGHLIINLIILLI